MTIYERVKNYALNWLGAWIALFDNLVVILTAGVVCKGLDYPFVCWRVIRGVKLAKAKRLKEKGTNSEKT